MEAAQGPYVVQVGTEAARLGAGEDEQFGFLAVYTTDLGPQVVDGELKDVVLEVDGESFVYSRTGVVREGYVGGYVVSNDVIFGQSFSDKHTMLINPGHPGSVAIDLTGTMKAMDATRACQMEMGGNQVATGRRCCSCSTGRHLRTYRASARHVRFAAHRSNVRLGLCRR
ncbi:hypothetical protein R3X27_05520 [Tropicimonas sp. TH_r6]|uniref:hypothetical protein n=1 Tax=Tropicimonas sp. TH_r6 TaxID=3082085 RepID=UPI0029536289|nr:hypothetical protein [Tropicimonas sp. TH_r6]MDV7142137.1 hypothetical protein [Tropicimonas sp. TH_r6]